VTKKAPTKKTTKTRKTTKRKASKAATAVLEVVAEEVPAPPPLPLTTKAEEVPEKRLRVKCAYCSKVKELFWVECDSDWELPDHPDHISRNVCVDCSSAATQRSEICLLVYEAMDAAMGKKSMTGGEITSAQIVARRAIDVAFDDKALIKLARQLKVKHPWLKEKRSR